MQRVEMTDDSRTTVDNLTGQPCAFCDEGRLAPGEYKDKQAVICEGCDTPAIQLWEAGRQSSDVSGD